MSLEAALAAGEERAGDLVEVLLHRVERLGEALLDRVRELLAELLELGEAVLEVDALRGELLEAHLLGLVLLLRERIDGAERLAAALEALDRRGERVAVFSLGRFVGARGLAAAARFVGFGAEPRGLDLDGGGGLGHRGELLANLDLGGAELAELCAELGRRSGVSFAERRLEARGGDVERAHEALGERDHARRAGIRLERVRAVGDLRVAARRHLVELGCERAAPRLHLEEQRLGRLAGEPELAARRVVAEAFDRDRGDRAMRAAPPSARREARPRACRRRP